MEKTNEQKARSCEATAKACAKRKDYLLATFYKNAAAGFELKAEGKDRRPNMVIRKNKKSYTVETNRGRVIYETKKQTEAEKVLAYLREKANQ
jgi:hypothetical protein